MSSLRLQLLLVAALLVGACSGPQRPQLKVLGVEHSERRIKLFVEVTNYARRPMHLQRLEYSFHPAGSKSSKHKTSSGVVSLSRTVEAGSAVVVEVPIIVGADLLDGEDLELRGELIAEQDQVLRAYPVTSDLPE
jgi:hypothetical protein